MKLREFPDIGGLQVLQVPARANIPSWFAAYQRSGLVQYAEPDFIVHALVAPNDFRYWDGSLWNLHNTGIYGGTPGADIHAPQGWDVQHTAPNIIIADIDTGVRLTHEDIAPTSGPTPTRPSAISTASTPSRAPAIRVTTTATARMSPVSSVRRATTPSALSGGLAGADHGVQIHRCHGQRVHFRCHHVPRLCAHARGQDRQRQAGAAMVSPPRRCSTRSTACATPESSSLQPVATTTTTTTPIHSIPPATRSTTSLPWPPPTAPTAGRGSRTTARTR